MTTQLYYIICAEIYLLACILFLAGKDATSYKLKDHNRPAGSLQTKRVKRWHRDGVALWVLCTLPVAVLISPWLAVLSGLIRAMCFDPAFNHWAGLSTDFLGGSAMFDRFFVRLFGERGALKKAALFLALVVLMNIFYYKLPYLKPLLYVT
jgi:hypothetical protein